MKIINVIVMIAGVLFLGLVACSESGPNKAPHAEYSTMADAVNHCDGTVVVMSIEYSSNYYPNHAYRVTVRDGSSVLRYWNGGETSIEIGDTLKH